MFYLDSGDPVPFMEGFVFTVYLNPRREIYHWRPDPSDPRDQSCPLDFDTRFGELVWSKTS